MSLRPVPARWFEVLTPRAETANVAGTLARTGAVELEVRQVGDEPFCLDELGAGFTTYRRLTRDYARYWSRGQVRRSPESVGPLVCLRKSLGRIGAWQRDADPLIARLQDHEEELSRLRLWLKVLERSQERLGEFTFLVECGPVLEVTVVVLGAQTALDVEGPVLSVPLPLDRTRQCILLLGPPAAIHALRQQARVQKGRVLERPQWLKGRTYQALRAVQARIRKHELEIAKLYAELDALFEDHGLPEALGDLGCFEWFLGNVGSLPATPNFVRMTGWTADPEGKVLWRALEREGVPALVHLPPPPPGVTPPMLLHNPWWARPFEVFARALGTPGSDEIDPSPWLAVVVPLLFGYMFGDVGQGAVIAALGWWLRGRWSLAPLLVAAGISAVAFGFLFGSLFGREDVIAPLWLSPLHDPLAVLTTPLVGAVLLLTLGQVLNGVEALWRGELRHWLLVEAGFLLMYLGVAAMTVWPGAGYLAVAGALWYLAGKAWAGRSVAGVFGAVGSLFEDGMRLAVNTVSFARVGAFALAHGGLSAAVVSLADASSPLGALVIMVVGNALVITLEALVVSIQTTRLVLFEFFARFLRAEGRRFRPLPPPPAIVGGQSYETAH